MLFKKLFQNAHGDKIIIGEEYATVDGRYRAGKVYLFSTDREHLQTFEPPSTDAGAEFEFAVSVEGDTVVIGEPWASVDGEEKAGKIHIYGVGKQESIQETVIDEKTTETTKTEPESSEKTGIPGFPFESLLLGIFSLAVTLRILSPKKYQSNFEVSMQVQTVID